MAMGGPAPGKPLTTFGDMLRDLSGRRPAPQLEPDEPDSPTAVKQKKIAQLRAMFYSADPKAATTSAPGPDANSTQFDGLNLVDAFERVYADLTDALSGDGDEWIGLSEQLSTVLKTANQLIATAQNETAPLVDQIRSLQALVERGRSALANAQISMDQTQQA
ncbi:hypothetical protein M758_3G066600 [Ceratodon purpureus]|nr:hypothetical protein M758_3G066600 [Ceratodon purpureus]